MKVSALIPLKTRSERLPNKNLLDLGGVPLFCRIIATLSEVNAVDDISIFASNSLFASIARSYALDVTHVERSTSLDLDDTSITDVISAYCRESNADIIVLAHATSPFITKQTISACIRPILEMKCDSSFVAIPMQKFAWFDGSPINYDLSKRLPRTQDLQPLFIEQSGIYVFSREKFLATQSRIGSNPYIHIVNESEGIDIDTEIDYQIACELLK